MSLDALVQSLVTPVARARMPFRLPFRRRPAVVRGLTVGELLSIAAANPASATVVWAVVGLVPMPDTTSEADQRVLFDIVRLAVGATTPVDVIRLLKLTELEMTALLRAIVDLTMPSDTDELFEPVDSPSSNRGRGDDLTDGAWLEPAVALTKLALGLQSRGFDDPLGWTPGRLLFVQSVLGEEAHHRTRRDLVTAAYAGRLAQADTKGWKAGLAELGA